LKNYWGYSTIAFFAPKASYAHSDELGRQVNEFKEMIRQLHAAGIEVILDIVFNHSGEGDQMGHTFSFRGIDNRIYYMLAPERRYYMNYSGCGNTLNCNHPVVRGMIIDALRYWVQEMHIDGFRFDLGSILGRDENGELMDNRRCWSASPRIPCCGIPRSSPRPGTPVALTRWEIFPAVAGPSGMTGTGTTSDPSGKATGTRSATSPPALEGAPTSISRPGENRSIPSTTSPRTTVLP
jgi:hypothetical protein